MQFTVTNLELPVRIVPDRPLSDEELLQFCADNELLRIEREPGGELTVMTPTGTGPSLSEDEIYFQLSGWARASHQGVAFGSTAGFRLPDGSMRASDAAFASWERWNALPREQRRKGFAPLCPEFVIELRSPSDRLPDLQHKMGEWLRNGVQLGWLVDPERQVVEVYRAGEPQPALLQNVGSVTGDGPVAGFVLELSRIWDA